MKAAVRTRYGPPEVVRVSEVAKPTPKKNEVLVKVHATTVNRTDCGFRAGKPFIVRFFSGLTKPRETILGTEFAGNSRSRSARRHIVQGWRQSVRIRREVIRRACRIQAVRRRRTRDYPGELDVRGNRSWYRRFRKAKIHRGQDVLVNGATGAIGSAAVQLIKDLGANVTAVCGTESVELVGGLGADRVIDYTAEDFTKDAQTYDVVLDAVGKSSFGRCKRLLKPGGIYLSSELGPK